MRCVWCLRWYAAASVLRCSHLNRALVLRRLSMDSEKIEVELVPKDKKDNWDKWKILSASLLIPLIGYLIHVSSSAYKMTDSNAQVLALAVEILKSPASGTTENRELRSWAVDIVNRYAIIELPESLKMKLEESSVLPTAGNVDFSLTKANSLFGLSIKKDYKGNFAIHDINVSYKGRECKLTQEIPVSFDKEMHIDLPLVSLPNLQSCSGLDFSKYKAVGLERHFYTQNSFVNGVTLSIVIDYSTNMTSSVSQMTAYFMPIEY
ncbi:MULTISPECIES: hypothetical protein [unclassified Vibrio]|uniref:hypothetical protein n=1 Tax=unclassified Vibrio TaxID=2614977 RepID=UPI00285271CF|nr:MULTISPECIES: hypothetical protein [unclassified Vibrio]